MLQKYKSLSAFTFAELALVLMIIGVIAAMTIPSLKKHSQRSEFARGAQKAYFTLNECFEQAILVYGPPHRWKKGSAGANISEHLKLTPEGTTQDGMNYTISCGDTGCDFKVDINGTHKPPNKNGKDIFEFTTVFSKADPKDNPKDSVTDPKGSGVKVDLTNTIKPIGDCKTLMENNWKFTDALWNK